MRIVSPSSAAGKKLGQTIYAENGDLLLRRGTTLSPLMVESLVRRGYQRIPVANPLVPDLVVDEVVDEATRVTAEQTVRYISNQAAHGEHISYEAVSDTVYLLMESLRDDVLYGLSAIRLTDQYTFAHSVQVCILSLLLGKKMFLGRSQLFEMGMGTILHDIGKIRIPAEILNKPGRLSEEEFTVIKNHTEIGYRLLVDELGLSYQAAHIAFQHHERIDGSGYPRGLTREEIIPFARLVAIADVYDAMTHDRVYRQAHTLTSAAEEIQKGAGIIFEDELARRFLSLIALYPNGTIVLLNTGSIAVVIEQNQTADPDHQPQYSRSPVVRVVSEDRKRLCQPYDINLLTEHHYFIDRILPDFPPAMKIRE